jgi:hypothetical protein
VYTVSIHILHTGTHGRARVPVSRSLISASCCAHQARALLRTPACRSPHTYRTYSSIEHTYVKVGEVRAFDRKRARWIEEPSISILLALRETLKLLLHAVIQYSILQALLQLLKLCCSCCSSGSARDARAAAAYCNTVYCKLCCSC